MPSIPRKNQLPGSLTELVIGVAVLPGPADPEAVLAVGGQPLEGREGHVVPVAEVDVRPAPEQAVAPRARRTAARRRG